MTTSHLASRRRPWILLLIALLQIGIAHAQDTMSFVSGPSIDTMTCPDARQPLKPAAPPSFARPATRATGAMMPVDPRLGVFRALVIRDQPLLGAQALPGLAIEGAHVPHRVAFWGDSHIAAGPFIPTLVEALRGRGLTVGTGYLPPSMGRPNTHLFGLHAYCIGQAWSAEMSFISPKGLSTGPGLMNRSAEAGSESYLWLDLRDADRRPIVRQLQIVYRSPTGGTLDLSINNGKHVRAPLHASDESQTLTIRGDAPIAIIKMHLATGSIVLHGFMLEDDKPPALTLDVFGVPSATARGWVNADTDYLAHTVKGVTYDGVVMEYGTNEGNNPDFDREKYAVELSKALTHMRQIFPSASCLLVGPPDRGVLPPRNGGAPDLLKFGRIHAQIEAEQQRVGKQFNCSTWNWQDLMGGPGGSYGWRFATPPLMGNDLTHLSTEGYKRTAHALARSLGWEN